VFFSPELPEADVPKLKLDAAMCGFAVALTAGEAGVTHVIREDTAAVREETSEDFCRTLVRSGTQALVHWWYVSLLSLTRR
jgi:hypothetical protein